MSKPVAPEKSAALPDHTDECEAHNHDAGWTVYRCICVPNNTPAPERVTLSDEERTMGSPMYLNDVRVGLAFLQADVERIIAAREQALREQVQRVREIHGATHWCFGGADPSDLRDGNAYEIDGEHWPCPTLAALGVDARNARGAR